MKAKGTEPLTPGMGAKSKAERITNGTPALNSQGRYLPAFDVSFVNIRADHRIPKDIDDSDKKKYKPCRCRADGINRQHVKSQKAAYCAKNQVLSEVAHTITNTFSHALIYDIHHGGFALCFYSILSRLRCVVWMCNNF
ncbi:Uncharacterised protein [Klebsiella michiganensis]|uniref:Uncharacterized protein n=1 Tax=Klebsiella michiganensis TaxID=1134687 RepID=A0A7H4N0B4_9ENTR|nr:Uncharacterised protein [Klebsiella michiganensis]